MSSLPSPASPAPPDPAPGLTGPAAAGRAAPAPAAPAAGADADADAWDRMVEGELRVATGRPDLTLPDGACDTRPCRMLQRPPRDLVGLALSGGGNRSATFNLGLLQGLHDLRLLPTFDYLATVSGGGYVGGFWSAWRARTAGEPGARAFPGGGAYAGRAEAPEVRHLRQFSNFLSPKVGLLSWDTGRMVAAAVSGAVPALAAALALVALTLGAWLAAAWRLAADAGAYRAGAAGPLPAALGVAALLGALLAAAEWVWRRSEPTHGAGAGPAAGRRAYALFAAAAALVTGLAWALGASRWLPAVPPRELPFGPAPAGPFVFAGVPLGPALVLAPAAACAAAAAALAMVRMLASTRRPVTAALRATRSAAERVLARVLLGAALWAAVGGVWLAGDALAQAAARTGEGGAASAGAAGVLALLSAVFTRVLRALALLPRGRSEASRARRLATLAPAALAYVIVGGLAALTAWGLVAAHQAAPLAAGALAVPPAALAYAAAALVVALTLCCFDANTVGLHAFYRARLARAYLGASNHAAGREYAAARGQAAGAREPDDAGGRQSEEQPGDDLPITALGALRPVHLVCCAANDLAPRDPVANLRRGARSAVLSAHGFGVGDAAAAWAGGGAAPTATNVMRARAPGGGAFAPVTLGAAMTASAAAFNSQMGIKSVQFGPAVTFLLAALNLRLGLWLPHPSPARRAEGGRLFRLPGAPFLCELLGLTRADGAAVHLSDGGHFENLAVYELVRRQCRYILVSDCGADPEVAFDDFGTLVRRVRQDFGVEIDIDLTPLRPGADGRARQHMVAGDVHYPTGDVGVLLYVKPTLVGTEPPDVLQYQTRNPAFPHESTGDQFYNEAQWESYRRLGLHAARAAFIGVLERLGPDADARRAAPHEAAARVFAAARDQWLPAPAGFAERAPELAARCATLDGRLHAAAPAPNGAADGAPPGLARGVYWELGALADAAGATDPTAVAALEAALPRVREALLLMEETFHVEPLARSRHPVYLGTLNYFARWAQLPATRFWWPVLRALHAPAFVAYAERQFGLAPAGAPRGPRYRVAERDFGRGGDTYVERCWRESGRALPDAGATGLQLTATLSWGEGAVDVAVAFLAVRALEARLPGAPAGAPPARVAVFDADWLFVPPGLWGGGSGRALLERCAGREDDVLRWAHGLLVRVPLAPRFGVVSWRERAALAQFYRARGFVDVRPGAAADGAFALEAHAPSHAAAPADPFARDDVGWRWLYRPVVGAPAGAGVGPGPSPIASLDGLGTPA